MASFLIWTGPGGPAAQLEFPDLGELLAAFRKPYAVDVWNAREQRWEMLDEVIEAYRGGGPR